MRGHAYGRRKVAVLSVAGRHAAPQDCSCCFSADRSHAGSGYPAYADGNFCRCAQQHALEPGAGQSYEAGNRRTVPSHISFTGAARARRHNFVAEAGTGLVLCHR